MKLPFHKEGDRVVAVDIGSRFVKVVEIEKGEDGPILQRYGTSHVSPDAVVEGEVMDRELLLESLEAAFVDAGIKKDRVVSAISSRSVIVKRLLLEHMSEEEARLLIEEEASQHIPFDLEDVSLDFQILDEDAGDGKMEVLLVAAKREVIFDHISLLRDIDVSTTVIDVDAFAIQNLHETLNVDQTLSTLINIGSEVTNINIVRDGFPLFTRDFSLGCGTYLDALQRDLQCSYDEALGLISKTQVGEDAEVAGKDSIDKLAEEIAVGLERSLAYLRSSGEGEELSAIHLSGGGGNLPGLRESIEERLRIPVKCVDPFETLAVSPEVEARLKEEGVSPLLNVALGLGMREVSR